MMKKQIGHVNALAVHAANNQLRVARPDRASQCDSVANLPAEALHGFDADDTRVFLIDEIVDLLRVNLSLTKNRGQLIGINGKLREKIRFVFVNSTEPRQLHHVTNTRHPL